MKQITEDEFNDLVLETAGLIEEYLGIEVKNLVRLNELLESILLECGVSIEE